jgi:hypothetical protein
LRVVGHVAASKSKLNSRRFQCRCSVGLMLDEKKTGGRQSRELSL